MIRVVLDTNVIVSAVMFGNIPRAIYRAAVTRYRSLTSADLLNELREVLFRPKFEKKIQLLRTTPQEIYDAYVNVALVINVTTSPAFAVRDVDDIPVIQCAVAGQADFIVTGDADLLTFNDGQYGQMKIVTPARFLEIPGE